MKRSQINQILEEAEAFIASFGFELPPFAYLPPEEMKARRKTLDNLIDARLGWDITDYGAGDFDKKGLFLFTLRNGSLEDLKHGRGMCYAEKIMISRKDQLSPMHRHIIKGEDIINRGGATLALQLYNSGPEGELNEEGDVTVYCDGIARTLKAGGVLQLSPGESVTLMPGNWHSFWGEGGDVLIGEVSTVNDDVNDNIFYEPIARFTTVEEDEPPKRLLVSDYERWL